MDNNTSFLEFFCANVDTDFNTIEVVAFDVFDTILYRKVSPTHVHRMWANKVIIEFDLKITVYQLLKMKFEIAKLLKLRSVAAGKDKEYKYVDMAALMHKRLKLSCPKEHFIQECIKIELEVEKEVTFVPEFIQNWIYEIRNFGKRIICISDFYLPYSAMYELLHFHGLDIEKIYVSCELMYQKSTGRLYTKVIDNMAIEGHQMLMIGDNMKSDVVQAKNAGMKTLHINNQRQHDDYKMFEEDIILARNEYREFIRSNKKNRRNVPFSSVAFLMYIFIHRLYGQLIKDGCKHVLFMSREGEFFKKLFDQYQEERVSPEKRIKTHYFYISRRASLVPSIYKIEKDSFQEIYKNYPEMSVLDFLRNLGMEEKDDLLMSLSKQDINVHCPIRDFSESKEYDILLKSDQFISSCHEEAATQRNFLIKYLDDMQINYQKDGLYIVDVGYSGTCQNNINKIFDGKVDIFGYYMISYANKGSCTEHSMKKGIIYDVQSESRKDAFTYNSAVIEMLSLASHNGVDGYALNNGQVVPVFHYNEQELKCYKNIIKKIQDTVIDMFSKIANLVERACLDENSYYATFLKEYKHFIFNPSIEEINAYLSIPFVDNFAIYREYTPDTVSRKHPIFSFKGLRVLLQTRGQCLKSQNTHWIAAAMYKCDLRCLNPIMLLFSNITMMLFDLMAKRAQITKGVKMDVMSNDHQEGDQL